MSDRKGRPTRRRAAVLADQRVKAGRVREWYESRMQQAEKRRKDAAKAREEARAEKARKDADSDNWTPGVEFAVQAVDRDERGRMVPYTATRDGSGDATTDRDRSLRGKARIRARKAARRDIHPPQKGTTTP